MFIQFIGQAVGLWLLHSRKRAIQFPFRMPLFPIPIILAIGVWSFVFISTGWYFMLSGLTVIALGAVAYLVSARVRKQWPFQ